MSLDTFQAVLEAPVSAARVLEEGLIALSHEHPPLRRAELRVSPGDDTLLVSLGFDDPRAFIVQHRRVGALAMEASGTVSDLEHLSSDRRAQLESRRASFLLRARADQQLEPVLQELRRYEPAVVLRVSFDSEDALLDAWARHVGEGALFVPTSRELKAEVFSVIFVTPTGDYPDNRGLRVHRETPGGRPGVWLELQPAAALTELLSRTAREQKESRPPRVSPRPVERFEGDLVASIDRMTELRVRWEKELKRGGFFVRTDQTPALRSRVRLVLSLPNGEVLTLPAEVVLQETYPQLGVGLQLVDLAPGALDPIEQLVATDHRKPHVLVVEDEAIWRSTLSRVLEALDVEVTMASDGREGMVKLIEHYFDLDLVILDLHMPEMDGRGLIERVRRLGGDQHFKIFLFSAAGRAELATLEDPWLATEIFSKLDPLDVLATHLARELGRQWPPPRATSRG